MKKFYVLFTFLCCLLVQQSFAQRYTSEVFTDDQITVVSDITYRNNMSVIAQLFVEGVDVPTIEELKADIYMPSMDVDDVTDRPVVFISGPGTLPQYFVDCWGDKADLYRRTLANRLAKRGFVVISMNQRSGINPAAPTPSTFLATLADWAGRQTIDFRTAARFMRKQHAENGNPYGISPDKFIVWGTGTGTVALNAGYARTEEEYQSASFLADEV